MVTLIWETVSADDRAVLEDAATRHTLELVPALNGSIAHAVLPALAKGGVVAVVADDNDASRLLGLGVDEVVRSGRLTSSRLDDAVLRAQTRAEARVVREALARSSGDDDGLALRTLAGAVSHEVNNPLAAAVLDTSTLTLGLSGLLELHALLLQLATQCAPEAERAKIEARASSVPTAEELQDMVHNIAESIQRASEAMRRFAVLANGRDADVGVSAALVAVELGEILRGYMDATLTVESRGECQVKVPRATLVATIGAMMAHALDAVRLGSRSDRRISLRVSDEESVVLIEVEHSGASIPPDLRPNVFGPFFRREGGPPATGLQGIRKRARRWGGEFLVVTEQHATTFRLVLPHAHEPTLAPTEDGVVRAVRAEDVDD